MNVRNHAVRLLFAMVVLLPMVMAAQDVTPPGLKAAYIHKFIQFTNWPDPVLPAGTPITICVVGDTAVRGEVERMVKSLSVAGHPLSVTYGTPDKLPKPCHVMYVSAVSRAQLAATATAYRGQPVLTMSDMEGFHAAGGIAELFYQDASLVFSIRLDEVKRSGIELSSRLLLLQRKR
jgi:hypothetical protein